MLICNETNSVVSSKIKKPTDKFLIFLAQLECASLGLILLDSPIKHIKKIPGVNVWSKLFNQKKSEGDFREDRKRNTS